MWLVVQYRIGCSPVVVAAFSRCCQAMERAAQLAAEFPKDRFYPRLESNFNIRRVIDDIASIGDAKDKSKKGKKFKPERFGAIGKRKEVISSY